MAFWNRRKTETAPQPPADPLKEIILSAANALLALDRTRGRLVSSALAQRVNRDFHAGLSYVGSLPGNTDEFKIVLADGVQAVTAVLRGLEELDLELCELGHDVGSAVRVPYDRDALQYGERIVSPVKREMIEEADVRLRQWAGRHVIQPEAAEKMVSLIERRRELAEQALDVVELYEQSVEYHKSILQSVERQQEQERIDSKVGEIDHLAGAVDVAASLERLKETLEVSRAVHRVLTTRPEKPELPSAKEIAPASTPALAASDEYDYEVG